MWKTYLVMYGVLVPTATPTAEADGVDMVAPFPLAAAPPASGHNVGAGELPTLADLGVPTPASHGEAWGLADLAPAVTAALSTSTGSSLGSGSKGGSAVPASGAGSGATCRGSAAPATPHDPRGVMAFRGGESAAIARLEHYTWTADCLNRYKETRNGLVGADYSSKMSPWLALGCISPRTIAAAVRAYEAARGANESTGWLIFELLWRDYFRYASVAWGTALFFRRGLRAETGGSGERVWLTDARLRNAWAAGTTGYPFVDANMRELAATGFMSNRGRQNVASFLAHDLQLDWRLGAEWFESQLIDHDVCSNYGNWQYVAGVGVDPREDRYFLMPKQSRTYDAAGDFMRLWVPELRTAPVDSLHEPHRFRPALAVAGGAAYPDPIVALLAHRRGGGGSGGGGASAGAHGGGAASAGTGGGHGGGGGARWRGRGGRVQHLR